MTREAAAFGGTMCRSRRPAAVGHLVRARARTVARCLAVAVGACAAPVHSL